MLSSGLKWRSHLPVLRDQIGPSLNITSAPPPDLLLHQVLSMAEALRVVQKHSMHLQGCLQALCCALEHTPLRGRVCLHVAASLES